jgi:transposase-like protein
MSSAALQSPVFTDETKAREWLEARVWANGRICPHCGEVDNSTALQGKAHRPGVYQCKACREQFTVTVGTVMERSKIPLSKWLMALYLMTSSKKGMSAHQMHRMLGVSYKSTWFMCHRLREAMKDYGSFSPMGGEGKTVEADETYIGRNSQPRKNARGGAHKNKVFALVERGGSARAFHVDDVKAATLRDILVRHVDRKSALMTDEAAWYTATGREFAKHEAVNHREEEYVRGNVHTNTIEGFFSIFKRGMKGVYQHCSEDHLHRYLTEFSFRYSHRAKLGFDDVACANALAAGIVGKRLTYRRTD